MYIYLYILDQDTQARHRAAAEARKRELEIQIAAAEAGVAAGNAGNAGVVWLTSPPRAGAAAEAQCATESTGGEVEMDHGLHAYLSCQMFTNFHN